MMCGDTIGLGVLSASQLPTPVLFGWPVSAGRTHDVAATVDPGAGVPWATDPCPRPKAESRCGDMSDVECPCEGGSWCHLLVVQPDPQNRKHRRRDVIAA